MSLVFRLSKTRKRPQKQIILSSVRPELPHRCPCAPSLERQESRKGCLPANPLNLAEAGLPQQLAKFRFAQESHVTTEPAFFVKDVLCRKSVRQLSVVVGKRECVLQTGGFGKGLLGYEQGATLHQTIVQPLQNRPFVHRRNELNRERTD